MKLKSRLLSAVLALTLIASSLGVLTFGGTVGAAAYPDVDDSKTYYKAVELLSSLGIIKGYEDGTFGPENDVTRAEFTVMLMRTMALSGIGDPNPANLPFSDCSNPGFSWAIADISTAASEGIINGMGDGTFAPDNQVTYDQAVKMVVCALGYQIVALEKVDNDPDRVFPDGYIAVAVDNQMLTDVKGTIGVAAKRWQIAQLLYNAMEVNLLQKTPGADGNDRYIVQEGRTMLNTKLKVYYADGTLTADSTESVRPNGATARDGYVVIQPNSGDELIMSVNGISTDNMVGHRVRYYYKTDYSGNQSLVHLLDLTGSSNIVDIDVADIPSTPSGDSVVGFSIEYWANDDDARTTTAITAPGTTVVINGRTVSGTISGSELKPLDGSLQLMDADKDDLYETVFVTKYDTYVVNTKNNTAQTITCLYSAKTLSLNEDEANVTITNTSGKSVAFTALKKYDVLSVRESVDSRGKAVRDVIVSTDSVSGIINGIDYGDNIVQVGSTDYKLSNFIIKDYINQGDNDFALDDEGVFYLDKDGRIAAFVAKETAASNYGYLVQTEVSKEILRVKILPAKSGSSFVVYDSNKTIKVDKVIKDAEDAQLALERASQSAAINVDWADKDEMLEAEVGLAPQLVRYSLNGGKIESIDTAVESDAEADSSAVKLTPVTLKYDSVTGNSQAMKYNSSVKEFKSDAGSSFRINSSTVFVVVPHDRGEMDSYSAKSATYLRNNTYYTVEAYDVESNYAKAVVIHESENPDAVVNSTSPVLFVTGKSDKLGDSGVVTVLTGFLATQTGVTQTEVTAESAAAVADVQIGDAIRYGINNKNQIKNGTVQVVASAVAGIKPLTSGGEYIDVQYDTATSNNEEVYSAAIGYAYRVGEDNILDVALTADPTAISTAEYASVVAVNNTKLLYYNSQTGEVTDETASLLRDDSTGTSQLHIGIETYDATQAETTVFVLSTDETLRVIYVID